MNHRHITKLIACLSFLLLWVVPKISGADTCHNELEVKILTFKQTSEESAVGLSTISAARDKALALCMRKLELGVAAMTPHFDAFQGECEANTNCKVVDQSDVPLDRVQCTVPLCWKYVDGKDGLVMDPKKQSVAKVGLFFVPEDGDLSEASNPDSWRVTNSMPDSMFGTDNGTYGYGCHARPDTDKKDYGKFFLCREKD